MVPAGRLFIFNRKLSQQSGNKVGRIERAPNDEINDAGPVDRWARPDPCLKTMEIAMRRALIAATLAALFGCSPAFAQVGGMGTPGIAATSPLGMVPGASVPLTGIPLGATELASPGLSPLTDGTIGLAGAGTTCSATGSASGGMYSSSTYDGGGMGMGTSLPGSAAICGTGSSSGASLTAAMPATSSSGVVRPGIPLGSVEIGNAGVSPLVVVPTPSASPSTMGTLSPSPSTIGTSTMPSMMGAPTMPSVTGTAGLSTNQTAMPCGTIVMGGPAMNC
jgi:hypothetical protein